MRKQKKKPAKKRAFSKKKEPEEIKRIKVRVIGIGGGGSSVVSEIAQRVKGASFIAANTDLKSLRGISGKVKKFHFGDDFTHGLGTGMNPQIGEEAAKAEKERIKKILEGQDFVILVSCLGGGLGSGASPVFASISKNLGNLTYGIFTLPFKFEGEKKMEIAKDSLQVLKRKMDALSIIPNERIFQIIEKTAPLNKALSAINKSLSDSLQSLIEIIYKPGLINIDFADLRTIFREKGKLAYLNSIEIGKEEEKEVIDKVINSPLYPYSINGAKGVLFNISGQKDLSLSQVTQISKVISVRVHKTAKIIFGVGSPKKNSKIRVSLLATGCSARVFLGKPRKKTKVKKKKIIRQSAEKKKEVKEIVPEIKKSPKPPHRKKKAIRRKVEKKKTKVKKKKQKRKTKRRKKNLPQLLRRQNHGAPSTRIGKGKKDTKIRRNAIQVKKDIEEEEAEIISREKIWETPTFLRKKMTQEE